MVQALLKLDRYPTLMLLHLDANYPMQNLISKAREEGWREKVKRSPILKSMAVAAWLTAASALEVSFLCFSPLTRMVRIGLRGETYGHR